MNSTWSANRHDANTFPNDRYAAAALAAVDDPKPSLDPQELAAES